MLNFDPESVFFADPGLRNGLDPPVGYSVDDQEVEDSDVASPGNASELFNFEIPIVAPAIDVIGTENVHAAANAIVSSVSSTVINIGSSSSSTTVPNSMRLISNITSVQETVKRGFVNNPVVGNSVPQSRQPPSATDHTLASSTDNSSRRDRT